MDSTFEHIIMTLPVFLTGLSAGLCFTWTNAVVPGIAKLDDRSFLSSFQQMNRTIINPLFIITFFGPSVLGIIGMAIWFKPFLQLLAGVIPPMLLLGGCLALYLGFDELKDTWKNEENTPELTFLFRSNAASCIS